MISTGFTIIFLIWGLVFFANVFIGEEIDECFSSGWSAAKVSGVIFLIFWSVMSVFNDDDVEAAPIEVVAEAEMSHGLAGEDFSGSQFDVPECCVDSPSVNKRYDFGRKEVETGSFGRQNTEAGDVKNYRFGGEQ